MAALPMALLNLSNLLLHRSGLQTLHIKGADRLQEDAVSMLAPLAATLQELSLQGCHALRDRAGQHLQALTRLTHLDIGGWRPLPLPVYEQLLEAAPALRVQSCSTMSSPRGLWLLS